MNNQRAELMQVKSLEWASDTISRFWDYMTVRKCASGTYFSNQVGEGIVHLLLEATPISDRHVLDYGCGPGFLINYLLKRQALVAGLDFSLHSINAVNEKYRNNPNWKGARQADGIHLPWPDSSFDIVVCVETIEHVLEEQLAPLFQGINRLLKPDGIALFTTPNDERLERNTVFCPNCCTEFHRMQHLRSWTEQTLHSALHAAGYEVIFCRGLNLKSFQHRDSIAWKDLSPRHIVHFLKRKRNLFLDRLAPRPFPLGRQFNEQVRTSKPRKHLVAVAQRT